MRSILTTATTLTTLKTTKNIFYIKYIVFLTLCIFVCYTKLQRIVYIFKACALFSRNDRSTYKHTQRKRDTCTHTHREKKRILAEWIRRGDRYVENWMRLNRSKQKPREANERPTERTNERTRLSERWPGAERDEKLLVRYVQ